MAGNVCEWVYDYYGPRLPGGIDPTGPTKGKYRVFRGGFWASEAFYCRSATRDAEEPSARKRFIGFRVCRGVGKPKHGNAGKPKFLEKNPFGSNPFE